MTKPGEAVLVPVLSNHRFDEAALARYLSKELPGFRGPMTVRQFQGGQSNPSSSNRHQSSVCAFAATIGRFCRWLRTSSSSAATYWPDASLDRGSRPVAGFGCR